MTTLRVACRLSGVTRQNLPSIRERSKNPENVEFEITDLIKGIFPEAGGDNPNKQNSIWALSVIRPAANIEMWSLDIRYPDSTFKRYPIDLEKKTLGFNNEPLGNLFGLIQEIKSQMDW